MISSAAGTASTPRAHITNMAALDCLRDIGVDTELNRIASKGEQHMAHTRWCRSMAGEEYARVYSWGNDPRRKVCLWWPCCQKARAAVNLLKYRATTRWLARVRHWTFLKRCWSPS
jgi:hypothetical protein